jgi:hypothetical protein
VKDEIDFLKDNDVKMTFSSITKKVGLRGEYGASQTMPAGS